MQPEKLPAIDGGTVYYRNNAVAGLTTILAPAANVAGAVVQVATLGVNNNAIRLMVKSTAPASIDDAGAKTLLRVRSTGILDDVVPFSVFVPAGEGVYEWASAATDSVCSATVKIF